MAHHTKEINETGDEQYKLALTPEPDLIQKFRQYHKDNPHVYVQLRSLSFQAMNRGFACYGIGALAEVIRWNRGPTKSDDFKLSNSHRACYSRMLMQYEPSLRGFFRLKPSIADAYFKWEGGDKIA